MAGDKSASIEAVDRRRHISVVTGTEPPPTEQLCQHYMGVPGVNQVNANGDKGLPRSTTEPTYYGMPTYSGWRGRRLLGGAAGVC